MRTIKTTLLFAAVTLPLAAASSGALTEAERTFLIGQLEKTKTNFFAAITGLSDAQWRFKPAPNVWSVAECAEHIILSEELLFNRSQALLKAPAVERPATSNAEQDKKLSVGVEDRSQKATAPEPLKPSGRFPTSASAAIEFMRVRDKSIAYVKSTNDDLRVHVSNGPPFGTTDAYQFLVLMAAHSARHTAQIREVQANAAYPKSKAMYLVTWTLARANSVNDLTPADMAKFGEHAQYLSKNQQSGILTWGGRTMDANRPRGLAIVEVDSEDQLKAFTAADPAVQAGLLKTSSELFQEAFRSRK